MTDRRPHGHARYIVVQAENGWVGYEDTDREKDDLKRSRRCWIAASAGALGVLLEADARLKAAGFTETTNLLPKTPEEPKQGEMTDPMLDLLTKPIPLARRAMVAGAMIELLEGETVEDAIRRVARARAGAGSNPEPKFAMEGDLRPESAKKPLHNEDPLVPRVPLS